MFLFRWKLSECVMFILMLIMNLVGICNVGIGVLVSRLWVMWVVWLLICLGVEYSVSMVLVCI